MKPESSRILLWIPSRRDRELAEHELSQLGMQTHICPSLGSLIEEIRAGAGAALLTEEALDAVTLDRLRGLLRDQPAWSDFPFVVVGRKRDRDDGVTSPAVLGNVTILDPPLRVRTLERGLRSALRGRERQYQAARAIAERDRFLAMLGHELRNPLGAVKLAAEVLRASDPAPSKELGIIHRQTAHLSRLVDDLLDIARVTTGKLAVISEPQDVDVLLRRAVDIARPGFEQAGISLTVDRDGDSQWVLGDATRLEQVMSNLLNNARKYSDEGGRVRVETSVSASSVTIRVEDDGAGMDAELCERAFEAFSQADETLARSQGGMGIGLALVRSVVDLHGGSVTAQSDGPGCGSTFTVVLPRLQESGLERASPAPTAPQSSAAKSILVIDDHEDAAELLGMLLSEQGHRVVTAYSGEAGLELAKSETFDAAIVDIGLPGIDGYEVARGLRRLGQPNLVVLALSGYGLPADRDRSAAAGFSRHFTKPADVEALLAALEG